MLNTENCPRAAATYSAKRMVLSQNRNLAIALEAPILNISTGYYHNDRSAVEHKRNTQFFLFASYVPLLLATSTSEDDSSGVFVLIACCVLAFFLFGGRRSKQIKD